MKQQSAPTHHMKTKKELKNEYKAMKLRAGIFQIKNKADGRVYLKTTMDLDRAFNSDLFQLKAGMHSSQPLQNDWNKLGSEQFDFEIFDELQIKDNETPADIQRELNALLKMHLNEMAEHGQQVY